MENSVAKAWPTLLDLTWMICGKNLPTKLTTMWLDYLCFADAKTWPMSVKYVDYTDEDDITCKGQGTSQK